MDHTSIQTGVIDDVSSLPLVGVWFADAAQPHHTLDSTVEHFGGNGALSEPPQRRV